PSPKEPSKEPPIDRLIVKVLLESEDASWIDDLFPIWQKQIITTHRDLVKLHEGGKRVDRGHAASAYLTWIIENDKYLPNTVVFLPPDHQKQERDFRDAISNLQTPFTQSSGFANLHCPSAKTCHDLVLPFRSPPNEFRTLEVAMSTAWENIFCNITVPEQLATPPVAEFVVNKAQVHKRGVEEHLQFWTWLNKTKIDDDTSGMVFEYLWHVIFGRDRYSVRILRSVNVRFTASARSQAGGFSLTECYNSSFVHNVDIILRGYKLLPCYW
ncbi:hypothetical protein EJ02DRAFT_495519, partial [Clathrospora elynae]